MQHNYINGDNDVEKGSSKGALVELLYRYSNRPERLKSIEVVLR